MGEKTNYKEEALALMGVAIGTLSAWEPDIDSLLKNWGGFNTVALPAAFMSQPKPSLKEVRECVKMCEKMMGEPGGLALVLKPPYIHAKKIWTGLTYIYQQHQLGSNFKRVVPVPEEVERAFNALVAGRAILLGSDQPDMLYHSMQRVLGVGPEPGEDDQEALNKIIEDHERNKPRLPIQISPGFGGLASKKAWEVSGGVKKETFLISGEALERRKVAGWEKRSRLVVPYGFKIPKEKIENSGPVYRKAFFGLSSTLSHDPILSWLNARAHDALENVIVEGDYFSCESIRGLIRLRQAEIADEYGFALEGDRIVEKKEDNE